MKIFCIDIRGVFYQLHVRSTHTKVSSSITNYCDCDVAGCTQNLHDDQTGRGRRTENRNGRRTTTAKMSMEL
jgi:hypothetical protein